MSKTPPLLPAEALRRVLQVGRANGTSVLLVAGFCALVSASAHSQIGTWASLLAAGAGAIELHGSVLLGRAEGRGVRWLVASQVFLMGVIFAYIWYRQNHVDLSILDQMPEDVIRQAASQSGLTPDELKFQLYNLLYFCLGAGTLVYQG